MLHDGPLLPDPLASIATRRLALLIDADNVPRDKVAAMVAAASGHGIVDIRRAYGDWAGGSLRGWSATLHDHAIRPIQQFSYTAGKNASDIALVIDAMELLHTCRLDGFCIASSDADFTPLVMHLRANGRDVHGFGESKTPRPFVSACTDFVYLDPGAAEISVTQKDVSAIPISPACPDKSLSGDTKLVMALRNAVKIAARSDGWAPMGKVGNLAKQQSSIDPKAYGMKDFPMLFAQIGLFDIVKLEGGQGYLADRRNTGRTSRPQG